MLREGPIFAQVVLGDEINRAPAKTQSALLEAMQERQVTIEGQTRPLEPPFIVLATQNPIEQEGTYPLPEAQVDRFLVKLKMGYPAAERREGDAAPLRRRRPTPAPQVRRVLEPATILRLQELADAVHVEDELLDYVLALAQFTRTHRRVALGASPRAALQLVHAAKARALLGGRDFVLPDDVKHLGAVGAVASRDAVGRRRARGHGRRRHRARGARPRALPRPAARVSAAAAQRGPPIGARAGPHSCRARPVADGARAGVGRRARACSSFSARSPAPGGSLRSASSRWPRSAPPTSPSFPTSVLIWRRHLELHVARRAQRGRERASSPGGRSA